jgi:hypothetical protein
MAPEHESQLDPQPFTRTPDCLASLLVRRLTALTRSEELVDQEQLRNEKQQLTRRIAALELRAKTLGFVVAPVARG